MNFSIINAVVKFSAGKTFDTPYGKRINAVFSLANGQEAKIWANPDSTIAHLKKNQNVKLAYDGKNYALIPDEAPIAEAPITTGGKAAITPIAHPAKTPTSPDVAEWVAIFQELQAALPTADEYTWRSGASTIYIQRMQEARSDRNF
jgi:hypothetical protein